MTSILSDLVSSHTITDQSVKDTKENQPDVVTIYSLPKSSIIEMIYVLDTLC